MKKLILIGALSVCFACKNANNDHTGTTTDSVTNSPGNSDTTMQGSMDTASRSKDHTNTKGTIIDTFPNQKKSGKKDQGRKTKDTGIIENYTQ